MSNNGGPRMSGGGVKGLFPFGGAKAAEKGQGGRAEGALAFDDIERRLERLDAQLRAAKSESFAARAEKDAMKVQMQDWKAKWEAERLDWEQQKTDWSIERRRLRDERDSAQAELTALQQRHSTEATGLQVEVRQAKDEVLALEESRRASEAERQGLCERVAQLERELEVLKKKSGGKAGLDAAERQEHQQKKEEAWAVEREHYHSENRKLQAQLQEALIHVKELERVRDFMASQLTAGHATPDQLAAPVVAAAISPEKEKERGIADKFKIKKPAGLGNMPNFKDIKAPSINMNGLANLDLKPKLTMPKFGKKGDKGDPTDDETGRPSESRSSTSSDPRRSVDRQVDQ
eukprot:TRINITY_DN16420_c0_g1_i1.p1 TRINITY_DN16420_c0_g1~~TRINITY_DN16420_c0_g1_i1.p1  ORF type:complete len:348 (-),score=83.87 TRINITY_DN16420_c0_g1_i1:39-1082(-)